jgi:hypothetical protein
MTPACSFSQIIIIESLDDCEPHTGELLHSYLDSLVAENGLPIRVAFYQCDRKSEFVDLLRGIGLHIVQTGEIPLLHVECHGDSKDGLIFANGSEMSWSDLSCELLSINVATRFNLFAAFAACYGAHFLGRMGAVEEAPCWGLLAPTETVWPNELLRDFRLFYRELLISRSTSRALDRLREDGLDVGRWLAETAEHWFERVLRGYVVEKCNQNAARVRIRRLYRQLLKSNARKSMGFIKRRIRKHNRRTLLQRYFDKYFIVNQIPENARRFARTKRELEQWLSSIDARCKYLV